MVTAYQPSTPSLHLNNDLPPGATQLEIRKSLLGLFEPKYFVDHRPNASCLEKLTDLCELTTIRVHEQERIGDAALPGAANDLAAQQGEQEHHEKVHASGASERGVGWPDQRDDAASGLENPQGFF